MSLRLISVSCHHELLKKPWSVAAMLGSISVRMVILILQESCGGIWNGNKATVHWGCRL